MKIYFEDGQVANIELIDNDFVNYWKSIVQPLEEEGCRINTWNEQLFPRAGDLTDREKEIQATQIKLFNDCVDELEAKAGVKFPGKMKEGQDQYWLNQLHRWVTHGAFTKSLWNLPNAPHSTVIECKRGHWCEYDHTQDHSYTEFSIPEGMEEEVTKIIFDMNCQIHEYEETIRSPRRQQLLDMGWAEEDGYHLIQRYFRKDVPVHRDCYEMKSEWRDYCTYDDYDLWMPFAVLGKEYYTTWINVDSPAHMDVTNIDRTWYAGFEFQPNNFMNRTLNHPIFKRWLEVYGIPDDPRLISKIPLGTCTNKADLDLISAVRSQVTNVEF